MASQPQEAVRQQQGLRQCALGDTPPYTEAANLAEGVRCYMCEGSGLYHAWGTLYNHLYKQHGLKAAHMSGTFFHTKVKELEKGKKKDLRAKPKSVPEPVPKQLAEEPPRPQPTFQWLAHMCWVKCDLQGNPVMPLEVQGLCQTAKAEPLTEAQSSKEPAAASQAQGVVATSTASAHTEPEALVVQHLQNMGKQLESLQARVLADPKAWMKTVPHLAIKAKFVAHPGPPAKGEGLCTKALWPKEFKKDFVQLHEFWEHLGDVMNKKKTNLEEPYRCVGRAMAMLEETPGPQPPDMPGTGDLRFLVGMWLSRAHEQLMGLSLMSPKYTWAMSTMEGLVLYCQYHLKAMTVKKLHGEEGFWGEYSEALTLMVAELQGGHWKRCHDQLLLNHNRKMREDLAKLKKFPPLEERRAAVLKSFLTIKCVARRWAGQPSMPRRLWGLLNANAVGSLYNCTHGGRKLEWELALRTRVAQMVLDQVHWLVCEQHKGWKTYGDLAKWVPQCLLEMFACYDTCPRPEGVTTFFVPAVAGAPRVSFTSALRAWSKRHLDKKHTWPTVNDYRKYSHKVLMKLTESEEKLKEVMVVVDAHGKWTQDKHYILKEHPPFYYYVSSILCLRLLMLLCMPLLLLVLFLLSLMLGVIEKLV